MLYMIYISEERVLVGYKKYPSHVIAIVSNNVARNVDIVILCTATLSLI